MKITFVYFFSVFFFLGGLFPKTNFDGIFHIIDTIEHFQCHAQEADLKGNSFTLLDFITIHSFNNDNLDHHDEENHQHNDCFHVQLDINVFVQKTNNISVPSLMLAQKKNIQIVQVQYHFDYLSNLDRPPIV